MSIAISLGEEASPRLRLSSPLLLAVPALLLLLPIYVYPMLHLVVQSLGAPDWSLGTYRAVFGDPAFWPVMSRTFVISAEVALLCVLLGYPVAYAMLLSPGRWRTVITLGIMLPLWTSTLVRAYAWVALLGQDGIVNRALLASGLVGHPVQLLYTRFSVLVGFVHVMLPYFVFPLYGVMSRLDLRLMDAAAAAGARPWRAFLAVTLPLSLPGVAGGVVLIFILSLGFFVTPALLGGLHEITYVMLIEREVDTVLDWRTAAGMAVVFLCFTGVLVALFGRALGFPTGGAETRAPRAAWAGRLSVWLATRFVGGRQAGEGPRQESFRSGASLRLSWPLKAVAGMVVTFMVGPILILFPLSFSDAPYLAFPPPGYSLRWYRYYFSHADWIASTLLSLKVALATMLIATVIGGLAALGLSRSRSRARGACLALLLSPMIVPQLITAVGLYFQLAPLRLVGTATGLVIAHLVIAVPLVIVVFLSTLRSVDLGPERAARSLGEGPAEAFCSATLPLLKPAILSAALFAFLASFDDVIMALFMSGVGAETLPKRMWDSVVLEVDPTVASVSCLVIAFSVLLLATARLAGRAGQRVRRRASGAADVLERDAFASAHASRSRSLFFPRDSRLR